MPWIVKWPGGVKPGSLCHTPVSSVDFHPTILEIAGVQVSQQTIDGVSIAPLLRQTGEPKARHAVLALSPLQQPGRQTRRSGAAARS